MTGDHISTIPIHKKNLFLQVVFLTITLFLSTAASAKNACYDIIYIWDADLERVLDYQDQLESLLDTDISKHLAVVGRDNEYGIIYDQNGTALSSSQAIIHHSEILHKAGLNVACAIKDQGYHRLYNVSYGHGPNADALKKTYSRIYQYLGREVGKNLFIEQTDSGNYTLIYRRRGDRKSTLRVAKRHAKLLRSKKISTSLTLEKNNPVIYGESSHLDDSEVTVAKAEPAKIVKKQSPPPKLTRRAIRKTSTNKAVMRAEGNTDVEKNIEEFIKRLRKKGKISRDEMTSWMVYDFTRDKSIVDINANQAFQAASMIKPFIALAFFHQVKKGKLVYGPKSRRKMEAMIQRSNNPATNWVMRNAGGPAKCEKILKENYGYIFKKTEIKEYIPANGRTYRNSALPADYIRFLRALWNKDLPYGEELRRVMALPGRDRLYSGTPIPQGTMVYNKTGSTAHLCGDMGILVPRTKDGHRYPYAIVGIIERQSRPANYGNWTTARSNVIRQVSTLVYEEMKKTYKLL